MALFRECVDVFVVETPAVDRRALHRQLAQVGLVLNREVNAVLGARRWWAHDAALTGLTSDNAGRLAYDAGHAAALALRAAHGLRTGGGSGHHEVAFAGAAGLGGSALGDLVADSEEIPRQRRSHVAAGHSATRYPRNHGTEPKLFVIHGSRLSATDRRRIDRGG